VETHELFNSSFQAYLFPVVCLQNCRRFSSASFVPSYLSFCSCQILVTNISVVTAQEMTVIGTFILSSSSPAVYPKSPRFLFYCNRRKVILAPHIWLEYRIIWSCRRVLLWPVKDVTSCGHTFLVLDTTQSHTILWYSYTEILNWFAYQLG